MMHASKTSSEAQTYSYALRVCRPHKFRRVYSVLEGIAEGRIAEAAELLLSAAGEGDERSSGTVIYNSRLRFSNRRYSIVNSLQRLELVAPLAEIATSKAMLDNKTATARLIVSSVTKLHCATLLKRAADLKCHDLFPTDEELQCMQRFMAR